MKHVEACPGAGVVLVCFDPSSSLVAVAAPDADHAVGSCVVAVLGCLAAGLGLVGAAGRCRVTAGLGFVGSCLGVVGAGGACLAGGAAGCGRVTAGACLAGGPSLVGGAAGRGRIAAGLGFVGSRLGVVGAAGACLVGGAAGRGRIAARACTSRSCRRLVVRLADAAIWPRCGMRTISVRPSRGLQPKPGRRPRR